MATVRFRVLGALEVEVDGAAVELGGARQRAVLAVLLMHANEPVAQWIGSSTRAGARPPLPRPPRRRRSTSRGFAERSETTRSQQLTAGYLLRVPQGTLDTDELDELRARARDADPAKVVPTATAGPRPLARPAVCRPALRSGSASRDHTSRRAAPDDARGARRGGPRRRRGVTARSRARSACPRAPRTASGCAGS